VLLFLGTISYSLYLLHGAVGYTVDQLAARFLPLPPVTELAVQVAATLVLATLFWALIERPSTRLSQRIGRKVLMAYALVSTGSSAFADDDNACAPSSVMPAQAGIQ
jgi:peptidoglycan/LPS O-acetylase OafA/YrhL